MNAAAFPKNSKTKRICAGLLAVWLSGVVFLFCCGAVNARAAEAESCPLAQKGHCSKSTINKSAFWTETYGENSPYVDCCGFLPQLFNKVRKTESAQQIALGRATVEIKRPPAVFADFKPGAFFSYRPHLFNRGDTYLKNRVFRI